MIKNIYGNADKCCRRDECDLRDTPQIHHVLSHCRSRRALDFLSRGRPERRANDPAAPRPAVLFEDVRAAFQSAFRSLSLSGSDYPGFGHSDWPNPKEFAYTFDHYAEIMTRFADALSLSHYTLYMRDYGGPVGSDPNVERYDPDLWNDEYNFLNQPGQAEIQSDLFYDYRTNVDAYPKWQTWMREKQPRLLVIWGKYDMSFDLSEPEAYRRDVPNAEVHILDAGHFAPDIAADEIAALVRAFRK